MEDKKIKAAMVLHFKDTISTLPIGATIALIGIKDPDVFVELNNAIETAIRPDIRVVIVNSNQNQLIRTLLRKIITEKTSPDQYRFIDWNIAECELIFEQDKLFCIYIDVNSWLVASHNTYQNVQCVDVKELFIEWWPKLNNGGSLNLVGITSCRWIEDVTTETFYGYIRRTPDNRNSWCDTIKKKKRFFFPARN